MLRNSYRHPRLFIKRTAYNSTGGFTPKPKRDRFTYWGLAICVPCIMAGAYIAKQFANFLEKTEIYSYRDERDFDD